MKAVVIKTGMVVDVTSVGNGNYYLDEDKNPYKGDELAIIADGQWPEEEPSIEEILGKPFSLHLQKPQDLIDRELRTNITIELIRKHGMDVDAELVVNLADHYVELLKRYNNGQGLLRTERHD